MASEGRSVNLDEENNSDNYSVEMEEELEKENDEELVLEKENDEDVEGGSDEEIEKEVATKNDDQNGSKSSVKRVRNNYEEEEEDSRPKKIPKTLIEKITEKRLIIVLENASLESVKVSRVESMRSTCMWPFSHRLG